MFLTSSVTKDDQTNPKQLNFSHKFIANSYPDEKEIEINTKINLSILELNIKKFPTSSLQSPLGLWIGKNTFDNFYENVCNDLSGLDKTDKVTISITPTLSFTIDDTDLVKKIKTLTMAICTIRSQGTKLYPDLNEFAISLGELYQKNEDDIPFANISLNFNLKEDEYYSTNQRLENFQLLNSNDSYIQTLTQQKLGSTDEMDYNADNITNFANTFYLQNQKVKAIEVTVPQDSYFQIGGIYQLNFRESEFTLRDLTALDISKQEDDAQIDKKVIEEYKNIRNQFRSQVTYNNPSATIFIKPVSSHKSLKLTDTYMADIDEFIEVYKRDIELRNRPEAFQSIYEEINKIQSTFGDEKVPTNYDATTVKNKLNEQIEKVQKFYIETNTQILANQLKLTSEDLKSGLINGFYSKTGVPYFIQNSVILPTGEVDNYLSYTTMNVSTNMNMIDFELLSSLLSNELDTYTGLAENIMTIITLFKSMGYSRYRIGGYMLSGYAVGMIGFLSNLKLASITPLVDHLPEYSLKKEKFKIYQNFENTSDEMDIDSFYLSKEFTDELLTTWNHDLKEVYSEFHNDFLPTSISDPKYELFSKVMNFFENNLFKLMSNKNYFEYLNLNQKKEIIEFMKLYSKFDEDEVTFLHPYINSLASSTMGINTGTYFAKHFYNKKTNGYKLLETNKNHYYDFKVSNEQIDINNYFKNEIYETDSKDLNDIKKIIKYYYPKIVFDHLSLSYSSNNILTINNNEEVSNNIYKNLDDPIKINFKFTDDCVDCEKIYKHSQFSNINGKKIYMPVLTKVVDLSKSNSYRNSILTNQEAYKEYSNYMIDQLKEFLVNEQDLIYKITFNPNATVEKIKTPQNLMNLFKFYFSLNRTIFNKDIENSMDKIKNAVYSSDELPFFIKEFTLNTDKVKFESIIGSLAQAQIPFNMNYNVMDFNNIDNYFKENTEQTKINTAFKVIADHIRATTFAIADGVYPSNKDRGYIIRRLIRRSSVYGKKLGIQNTFLYLLVDEVIKVMKDFYPYLIEKREMIIDAIKIEEEKFLKTLSKGLDLLESIIEKDKKVTGYENESCNSKVIFMFKDDKEIKEIKNDTAFVILDKTPFYAEKGGQAADHGTLVINNNVIKVIDTQLGPNNQNIHKVVVSDKLSLNDVVEAQIDSEKRYYTMKNHSGTHLLHSAIREILGNTAMQAGSYNDGKLVLRIVLHLVEHTKREVIYTDIKTATEVHNALAFFADKYDDEVRIVKFGKFSCELCGGTHVENTKDIEDLLITSVESKGSGVFRFSAVTSFKTIGSYLDELFAKLKSEVLSIYEKYLASKSVLVNKELEILFEDIKNTKQITENIDLIKAKISKINEMFKNYFKEAEDLMISKKLELYKNLEVKEINNILYLEKEINDLSIKELKVLCDEYKNKYENIIITLVNLQEKVMVVSVSEKISNENKAIYIFKNNKKYKTKGGGNDTFAQGKIE
ncbi:hypothetical protein FQR65_LT19749 [Abscondita terminalis]|nr:hypothetical protein FQR65_LT19749 [Abscondita terminalis]